MQTVPALSAFCAHNDFLMQTVVHSIENNVCLQCTLCAFIPLILKYEEIIL